MDGREGECVCVCVGVGERTEDWCVLKQKRSQGQRAGGTGWGWRGDSQQPGWGCNIRSGICFLSWEKPLKHPHHRSTEAFALVPPHHKVVSLAVPSHPGLGTSESGAQGSPCLWPAPQLCAGSHSRGRGGSQRHQHLVVLSRHPARAIKSCIVAV